MSMRVLHIAYGGQMTVMCAALRQIGIDATSCHFRQGKFQFQPDICLHLEQYPVSYHGYMLRDFMLKAVEEYDVFHFQFGETFCPSHFDLIFLKSLGKKMVVQHRGSDVRRYSVASTNNPYVVVKDTNEERIISNLRFISQYIDHAIVADHELLEHVSPYYKHVHVIRQAVSLEQFTPQYPSPANPRPVLMHAPSKKFTKGSEFVQDAVEKLQKRGFSFEYRILENLQHAKALEAYQQADIIIDQFRAGAHGIVSLEAMAFGKPVVCYIRPDLVETYPEGFPIVNASRETLYQQLRWLIKSPEHRERIGREGRHYVEQHHDAIKIAYQLAELYEAL